MSIFQNELLAQIDICNSEQLSISVSNSFTTSPYVLEYIFESNGIIYGPNSSGTFDLAALGLNAPSNGTVYAINHDGTETFLTWPIPVSSCAEIISQTVNILSCDTLQVCQNGILSVSVSSVNLISPYELEYILALNGNLYGPNSSGNFDMNALGISAPNTGIVYAVNHDGTETFATWPTPVSTCIEFIEQLVSVNSIAETYDTLCNNNPSLVGTDTTIFVRSNTCDSLYIVSTTLLIPAEEITLACTNDPSLAGTDTSATLSSTLGCDSVYQVTQTTLLIPIEEITLACTNNPLLAGTDTTLALISALGCDSVYQVTQTTLLIPIEEITLACTNNPLLAGTDTTLALTSVLGCDSVYQVTQTTLLVPIEEITLACTNDSLLAGTDTTLTLTSVLGCDSVYQVTQTTLLIPIEEITLACTNNPLLAGTDTTLALISVLGCDSVYQVTQTTLPIPTEEITLACTNNPLLAGTDTTLTLTAVLGCDSVYQVTQTTLLIPIEEITLACTNDPSLAGTDTSATLSSTLGCDSVYQVTQTNLLVPTEEITLACTNNPLLAGTDTTLTLTSVLGCDSVYQVTETFLSDSTFTTTKSCLPSDTGSVTSFFVNINSCDSTHTVFTILDSLEVAAIASQNPINQGLSVSIYAQGDFASNYVWTLGNGSIISESESFDLNPTETTILYLLASERNCISTDSIMLVVNKKLELFLPTAFSPNRDGANDAFGVANYYEFESIIMNIYNRWGELLFRAKEFNPRWDGTYKDEKQLLDVYIFVIEAKPLNQGESLKAIGNITLIR
jgi:gliding motility-associated-like protein